MLFLYSKNFDQFVIIVTLLYRNKFQIEVVTYETIRSNAIRSARVFGDASPKFVDFLADVMSDQKEEVQQMSALSFDKILTRKIATVRLEISDIRTEADRN